MIHILCEEDLWVVCRVLDSWRAFFCCCCYIVREILVGELFVACARLFETTVNHFFVKCFSLLLFTLLTWKLHYFPSFSLALCSAHSFSSLLHPAFSSLFLLRHLSVHKRRHPSACSFPVPQKHSSAISSADCTQLRYFWLNQSDGALAFSRRIRSFRTIPSDYFHFCSISSFFPWLPFSWLVIW